MALPNIHITVNRSGLGQIAYTNDGIMGLIVSGASSGDLEVGKAYAIYGLADAERLGVEQEGDNAAAWKQIKEFYDEAGNGIKLWAILNGDNLMSTAVSGTTSTLSKLITAGAGEISAVGICRGKNHTGTIVNGLDEDVAVTMAAVQIAANNFQEQIMPFSAIIDGVGFTGDENTVANLHEGTKHRCSVLLAASQSDEVASIGQLLGRLASIPVQRKISRVKNGELTNLEGYLTDGESAVNRVGALNVLHDKGYIVYRTFPGRSGFFYSGDPTATLVTDDLNMISRNRIIDKVLKIAYSTYMEELDDDIPVTEEGTLHPAVSSYLQSKVEQQVNGNMIDEISSFSAFVDPNQNILSGTPLEIQLAIIPKGYLNTINVTIGFSNPLLND